MNTEALLYLIPTPLGNLGDFSVRAADIVKNLRHIACEDTRISAPFLKAFNADLQLFCAFEHVENRAASKIIAFLEQGESVGLVTDAGTPAVSDPGAKIVQMVRAAGFKIVALPGACAAITAFSMSGFLSTQFFFCGFLPPKKAARQKVLKDLKNQNAAIIFYESPHRILESLNDFGEIFQNRSLFIARELTKRFEESALLKAKEAVAWILAKPQRQKGEFVLILDACEASTQFEALEAERVLKILLDGNLSLKESASLAAKITGFAKNELYKKALDLKKSTVNE